MKRKPTRLHKAELRRLHEGKRAAIVQRLREFSEVPPSEYFYELVYCMLTPQSSAANAAKAVATLRGRDFFSTEIDPAPLLHQDGFYIRFHHSKGRHLVSLKPQFHEIFQHVVNGSSGEELREWLVKNVKGLGYKEASHFLRNIGHRDLAILDRHILKNLVRVGVLHTLPKSLTRKKYLAIEKRFRKYSVRIGIPMDELDLLFWSMQTGEILK